MEFYGQKYFSSNKKLACYLQVSSELIRYEFIQGVMAKTLKILGKININGRVNINGEFYFYSQ